MLELMYITNNPIIARTVDYAGVERVWIDLECIGKGKRQAGMDSVKSHHSISDIEVIRPILRNAKLQVRINPIHKNSNEEINAVIDSGADLIMLPYYKTIDEVKYFIDLVDKRVTTILLLETKEANECLQQTLSIEGVDEIHIGLNDLHLSYGQRFMFELLADGTVEKICEELKIVGKPFGFGGIAKMGDGMLPAEKIVAEHYRLGSTRAILSRSFCNLEKFNNYSDFERTFNIEITKLRRYEHELLEKDGDYFYKNLSETKEIVFQIVKSMMKRREVR